MIDNNLISYIENNLKAGYQPEQIREYLVSQGYPDQNVYDTIIEVEQRMAAPQSAKKQLNMMVVVPLVLLALVVVAVPAVLYFMVQAEPTLEVQQIDPEPQQAQAFTQSFPTGYEGVEVSALDGSTAIVSSQSGVSIEISVGEVRAMDLDYDDQDDILVEFIGVNQGVPEVIVTDIEDYSDDMFYDDYDEYFYDDEQFVDEDIETAATDEVVTTDVVETVTVDEPRRSIVSGFSRRSNADVLLNAWTNRSVLYLKPDDQRGFDYLGACWTFHDDANVTTYRIETDGSKNQTSDNFFVLEEYITEDSEIYSDGTYGLVVYSEGVNERLYFDEIIDETKTSFDAIDESELFVYDASFCEDETNFSEYVVESDEVVEQTTESQFENDFGVPLGFTNKKQSERLMNVWENKSVLLVAERFMRAHFDLGSCWEIGTSGMSRIYSINTSGSKRLVDERELQLEEYIVERPGDENYGLYVIEFWPSGIINKATFKEVLTGDEDIVNDTDGQILVIKPQGYCDNNQNFDEYRLVVKETRYEDFNVSTDEVDIDDLFEFCGDATLPLDELWNESYDHENNSANICFGQAVLDDCRSSYVSANSELRGQSIHSVFSEDGQCIYQVQVGEPPFNASDRRIQQVGTYAKCIYSLEDLAKDATVDIYQYPGSVGLMTHLFGTLWAFFGDPSCTGSLTEVEWT